MKYPGLVRLPELAGRIVKVRCGPHKGLTLIAPHFSVRVV